MNTIENITLPMDLAGVRPDREWLDTVIATVGLADRPKRRPSELIRVVEMHRPDLAIVDVRMPPTHTDDGRRAALRIRSETTSPVSDIS